MHYLGMNYYVNFLEGLGSNEFDKKSRFGTMVGLLLKVSREWFYGHIQI